MERVEVDPGEVQPIVLRFIRRVGLRNLVAVALLVSLLGGLPSAIAAFVQAIDAVELWAFTLVGLFVGLALGSLRLSPGRSAVVVTLLGLSLALIHTGNLYDELLLLVRTGNRLAADALFWFPTGWAVEAGPTISSLQAFRTGVAGLLGRSLDWAVGASAGAPPFDPLVVPLVWSLLVWFCAAWAGWMQKRYRQAVVAGLPAVLLLASVTAYVGGTHLGLLPALSFMVLLSSQQNHVRREEEWEREGVDYSEDIRLELALVAILLTFGVASTAAVAPYFSLDNLRGVQRFLRENFSQPTRERAAEEGGDFGESLGLQRRPTPQRENPFQELVEGGLPRAHLLGSGPELSEEVVMVIETGDLPPVPPESQEGRKPPDYYWRSLTYDRYTGNGWETSRASTREYDPGQPTTAAETGGIPIAPGVRLVWQEVRFIDRRARLLFTAGTPLSVNVPFNSAWRVPPDGDLPLNIADLFATRINTEEYTAISLYSDPSMDQLQASTAEYPQWVLDRYLQLPPSVPQRVHRLALELTLAERTPLARARVIEAYLRQFPYNLDLPVPPGNQDLADYFLFDLQEGYCDYYATAMVVLSRAAGIPARLAIGYAPGEYDYANASYVVVEANAHSWPEIFFPEYGWVRFEPTAGLPELDRSEEELPPPVPPEDWRTMLDVEPTLPPRYLIFSVLLAVLGVVSLLLISWAVLDLRQLRRLPSETVLAQLYRRMHTSGVRLRIPVSPGHTPGEFAAALASRLESLAHATRFKDLLASSGEETRRLTDLYTRTRYGPPGSSKATGSEGVRIWRALRWRLWLARLLKWGRSPGS